MKHSLFMLLLLCAGLLQAQEYSYTITSEPGDSTFTLDVVTELTDTRQDISRTTGIDTAGLQSLLYAKIERIRQEQARLEVQILKEQREAVTLLQALNAQNLNDYMVFQRAKLDSFYISENGWRVRNSAGLNVDLTTVYREGNTTLLRDTSNANFAAIVPLSSNYVRLVFIASDPLVADADVFLYSDNGRLYRGESITGVRYAVRRL